MPQLQLPVFPAGVTEINSRIAVQKDASTVWHIHGHLPVFQHEEAEVQSFRMFISQMIAYRAESSLASLLREHIARSDGARALLRQIFRTKPISPPIWLPKL